MKKYYFILICYSFINFALGQVPCTTPSLASFCDQACINCELDGLSLKTTAGPQGEMPQGYCTFIAHHMQWVGFIAGSSSLSFTVEVSNCTLGNSIELGVYSGCDPQNLVSNCETAMFEGSWSFTTTEDLEVGCPYYLVIDGNGPAECDFDVTVTSGSTSAPPVTIGDIVGETEACVGEILNYSTNTEGACTKLWTVSGGDIQDDPNSLEIDVEWTTPGLQRVCFSGSNACDPGGMKCIDVMVFPEVPDTELGPFKICEGDVYTHDGVTYTDGIYEIMYKNINDCDSLVILEVEEVSVFYEDRVIVVCDGECYDIADKSFCEPGIYEVRTQSEVEPFCDSVFTIDLDKYVVEPLITQKGSLGCGDTIVILRTRDSSNFEGRGFIDYVWRNEDGDVIGVSDSLVVNMAGKFCVEVLMSAPSGKICKSDTCTNVVGMDAIPELFIKNNPVICLGDSLDLRTLGVVELNGISGSISYHSAYPPDTSNEIDPPIIYTDKDTTIVVNFVSGNCGDTMLLPITVNPTPDIAVVDTIRICMGDTLFLKDIEVVSLNNEIGKDTFYFDADLQVVITDYIVTDSSQYIYIKSEISPCYTVDSIYLSIHELPVADIGVLPDSICMDGFISFQLQNWETLVPQIDVDGGQLSNLGNGNYEIRWSTPGSKKICVTVEDQFCFSNEICEDVLVLAPLEPVLINCSTSDSTITFSWNTVKNGVSKVIITTGQSAQNQTDSTLVVGNLNTKEQVEVIVIYRSLGPCADVSDTTSCIAIFCPDITISLTDVPLICLDANTPDVDIIPNISGSDGSGIVKWFGNGILDSLSPRFSPKTAGEGKHRVVVVIEESQCVYRDEIEIEVVQIPELTLSGIDTLCMDQSAQLNVNVTYGNNAVAQWDFGDATAVPGNGMGNQTLTWNTPGLKRVTLFLTKLKCASESVTKEFWVDAPLGALNVQCNSTFSTIQISWNDVQNAAQYDFNSVDNLPFQWVGPTSVLVDNLTPGTTTDFIITALSNSACSDVVQRVTCTTEPCPDITFQLRDVSSCLSDANTFNISLGVVGDTSAGTGTWSGTGITDANSGIFDPILAGAGRHTIYYTFIDDVCIYRDSMTIELFEDPIADAGLDAEIDCTNSSVTLGGGNTSQGANIKYSWRGPLLDSLIKNPIVTGAGTYVLIVSDQQSGCESRDEVVVSENMNPPVINEMIVSNIGCDSTINKGSIIFSNLQGDGPFEVSINNGPFGSLQTLADLPKGSYQLTIRDRKGCVTDTTAEIISLPKITLDIGPDLDVDQGQSVQITANTNIDYIQIDWSPSSVVSCPDCDQQTFVPENSMTVVVTVTDANGCQSTDELFIRVKIKAVYIPNTFTPNGDGINDELLIFGSEEVERVELMEIYNRWGELVFQNTNFPPNTSGFGWKGDFNGEKLNPNVYVLHAIVVYLDGTTAAFTTDVTLIR